MAASKWQSCSRQSLPLAVVCKVSQLCTQRMRPAVPEPQPARQQPGDQQTGHTHCLLIVTCALVPDIAAVRYRRWRNGVASGRLPDGTTSSGSSKEAAISMTAGELFRLEENEGFCDIEEHQQLQQEHDQEQQQAAARAAAQQQQEVRTQA